MNKRNQESLAKALRVLRDPGGDGKTKMSHGFTGQPMKCGRCGRPTPKQEKGIVLPQGAQLCVCT